MTWCLPIAYECHHGMLSNTPSVFIMTLTLHYHPLASYCWKVMIALHEVDVDFERHIVDLGDPQARAAFVALWPTGKMPLLVDGRRAVPESSIINEYLDRLKPGALMPSDFDQALEARLWDRLFDIYVMNPMQDIVAHSFRPENTKHADTVAQARATLAMAYAMIDVHMTGRTWAAGDSFNMADCAAFPALFYARTLMPFEPTQKHLAAYFERLVQRPSIERTLAEAQPYFSFYPFKDAIEARFLTALPSGKAP
jgi:glutathione S-transferase